MIWAIMTCRRRAHGLSASVVLTALTLSTACAGGPAGPPPPASPVVDAVVVAGPVCQPGAERTEVAFPDAALERAVRATLGATPDDPLTCGRLAEVTRLHAVDAGISDLSGIENLVRLGELHVYGHNSIRDVAPLAQLTALSDLNLARNQIADVTHLAALRTLTSLDLYGNPVRDVAPLGGLTGLVRVRIGSGVELTNLEALAALTRLSRLELVDDAVANLDALASLTQLTRLSLQNNAHLTDLTPLAGLANLEILELGMTSVSDISPIGGLPRLTTLGLAGTRVSDLGPLMGVFGLTRLDLRGDMLVSDVQPLLFHPAFGAGDSVRLEGSGVSCTDVAALEAKGVVVISTCR